MEGAAIGHICHKQGVPAVFIRCLSDIPLVDADNGKTFHDTLHQASKLAADLAVLLIMKITESI
jgi:nucleoside phosphorylase